MTNLLASGAGFLNTAWGLTIFILLDIAILLVVLALNYRWLFKRVLDILFSVLFMAVFLPFFLVFLLVDAIYNKAKRKRQKSIDIQGAEIIAPKGSPRLHSYRPDKVYDYSSGDPKAKTYAIMMPLDQKNICIYIDPDAKMIDHMKQWMGMKMFQD